MRLKRVFGLLTAISVVLSTLSVATSTSLAQGAGSTLAEDVTPASPSEGGRVHLDSVESFDPGGGEAVFEPDSAQSETFTYTSIDESSAELVGVSRSTPEDHPAGSFVQALEATPSPSPEPDGTASPTHEPSQSPSPTDPPASPGQTSASPDRQTDNDESDATTSESSSQDTTQQEEVSPSPSASGDTEDGEGSNAWYEACNQPAGSGSSVQQSDGEASGDSSSSFQEADTEASEDHEVSWTQVSETVTSGAPGSGGSLAVREAGGFPTGGGWAVLSPSTSDAEPFCFRGVDAANNLLLGIERPFAGDHAAETSVLEIPPPCEIIDCSIVNPPDNPCTDGTLECQIKDPGPLADEILAIVESQCPNLDCVNEVMDRISDVIAQVCGPGLLLQCLATVEQAVGEVVDQLCPNGVGTCKDPYVDFILGLYDAIFRIVCPSGSADYCYTQLREDIDRQTGNLIVFINSYVDFVIDTACPPDGNLGTCTSSYEEVVWGIYETVFRIVCPSGSTGYCISQAQAEVERLLASVVTIVNNTAAYVLRTACPPDGNLATCPDPYEDIVWSVYYQVINEINDAYNEAYDIACGTQSATACADGYVSAVMIILDGYYDFVYRQACGYDSESTCISKKQAALMAALDDAIRTVYGPICGTRPQVECATYYANVVQIMVDGYYDFVYAQACGTDSATTCLSKKEAAVRAALDQAVRSVYGPICGTRTEVGCATYYVDAILIIVDGYYDFVYAQACGTDPAGSCVSKKIGTVVGILLATLEDVCNDSDAGTAGSGECTGMVFERLDDLLISACQSTDAPTCINNLLGAIDLVCGPGADENSCEDMVLQFLESLTADLCPVGPSRCLDEEVNFLLNVADSVFVSNCPVDVSADSCSVQLRGALDDYRQQLVNALLRPVGPIAGIPIPEGADPGSYWTVEGCHHAVAEDGVQSPCTVHAYPEAASPSTDDSSYDSTESDSSVFDSDSSCNPSALPQLGKGDGFDFSAYDGDHRDGNNDGVADVYQPFEDFETDSHFRKLTDGDSLQHQAIRRPPSSTDQGGDGDPDRNAGRSRERDSGDVSVYRTHKADPYQWYSIEVLARVVEDFAEGGDEGAFRGRVKIEAWDECRNEGTNHPEPRGFLGEWTANDLIAPGQLDGRRINPIRLPAHADIVKFAWRSRQHHSRTAYGSTNLARFSYKRCAKPSDSQRERGVCPAS